MPPESKMEDLLKATARARRAEFGADPKMPNPLRAQLHDEIARLARREQIGPRRNWLTNFWPQFSFVSAVAAVLLTTAVLWNDREKSFNPNASVAVRDTDRADNVTDLAARPEMAADRVAKNETREEPSVESAVRSAPAAAAPPAQHYAASEGVARVEQQSSQTARGQAMRNNSQANQSSKILDNFQVEQDGNQIRLVDADGSTYSGQFEAQATAAPGGARRAAAFKSKKVMPSSASNERFFRASGYNTSLQKRVVFEGNYIPISENEQKKPAEANASKSAQQIRARIVGTAQIPGESPVEIDAAAIAP